MYDPNEEESDELRSESGSIGTYGTCLGGLLCDIAFDVGMTPLGDDLTLYGDGGEFFRNMVHVLHIVYVCMTSYYVPEMLSYRMYLLMLLCKLY